MGITDIMKQGQWQLYIQYYLDCYTKEYLINKIIVQFLEFHVDSDDEL